MENTKLFLGLSSAEREEALRLLESKEQRYKKGDVIISPAIVLNSFGVVISGSAAAYQTDKDGKEILFSAVQKGGCIATSLVLLNVPSPVTVVAAEDTLIAWLSIAPIKINESEGLSQRLFFRFAVMLAEDVLKMNERIRITSQPSIKKKLLALLELYQENEGEEFIVPMDRSVMAAYIGADRSALSRVISKLQREKIIRCNKNRFCILKEKP